MKIETAHFRALLQGLEVEVFLEVITGTEQGEFFIEGAAAVGVGRTFNVESIACAGAVVCSLQGSEIGVNAWVVVHPPYFGEGGLADQQCAGKGQKSRCSSHSEKSGWLNNKVASRKLA